MKCENYEKHTYTKNFRHIAVIPAREGSIGFPKKTQVF